MKKKIAILGLCSLIFATIYMLGMSDRMGKTVVINEVRSWNVDVTRDGYYGSDYIELYNLSQEEISLNGWYISDDELDLLKCKLSDISIESGGYIIIYANGKGDSGDSVSFKINPEGEKIFLSNAEGKLIDSIYIPKQELGTVYARTFDGSDDWAIKEPSFGESNNEKQILPTKSLEEPVFSHTSGFYEDAFELTITANTDETIYYTLDGSIPTKESMVYEEGILIQDKSKDPNVINGVRNIRKDWLKYGPNQTPVDKAVIVRAISMNQSNCVSDVVTHTYFIDLDKYKNESVISIVSEYDELFGDEGIFVTGKEYDDAYLSETVDDSIIPNIHKGGRNWEALGNMQILQGGDEILNQEIGIRIQGASSRNGKKKRMSIFARDEYSGNQYLKGLYFEDEKEAHSVMTVTEKANAVLQELVKDRNIATQSAMNNVFFLNGEYYYTGYILEKYNKYYLQDHYGVNAENVMIVKGKEVAEGPELSNKLYQQVSQYAVETDFSIEENYRELLSIIDVQSFIDYMCANIYFCNMDVSEKKNYMVWRTIEDEGTVNGNTRWRWMIYDVDCLAWTHPDAYGVEEKAQINSFSETMEYTNMAFNEHSIFASAKQNPDFCKQFVLTFMDMANTNFSIKNVKKVFEKHGITLDEYDGFFTKRFDYIVPYMAEEFGLTGTLEDLTVKTKDETEGSIQVNTAAIDLSEGSWSGKYYTDYPITITAMPAEGYRFVGWNGSINSESATIETELLQGGIVLEALFEKITN